MELVGEEKRIQALFSDVRSADERTTPSFAGLWNGAQSKTIRTQGAFNLSFVVATAGYSPGAKSRTLKVAARREASLVVANRKATREANKIVSWQSPTATLLESQSDELLKSLPQLNHTVDELKLFLPSQRK